MYNKLFTKILDSTIWLEDDATRLVWITFLAVMDEDGFVALSAIGNVAARARVSLGAAEAAIKALESPDQSDPSQEHSGRRIERVPYGWMVLNAGKYRDIVKREAARAATRDRVARFRAKGNGGVTLGNDLVTPSVAVSEADQRAGTPNARGARLPSDWKPSEQLTAWALKERPDLDLPRTTEKFRDYWTSKPGKAGAKLDWNATFRNWVREERASSAPGSKPAPKAVCAHCRTDIKGGSIGMDIGLVCEPCHKDYMGGKWS